MLYLKKAKMRYVLLFIIKIYWKLIPAKNRNRCIFKKSCSNYVFDITQKNGLLKGVNALCTRFKSCRPGYTIIDLDNKTYVITANHKMFALEEMRNDLKK